MTKVKPGLEPTPCDKLHCANKPLCKKGYACRTYKLFVESGKIIVPDSASIEPSRKIYADLFNGK